MQAKKDQPANLNQPYDCSIPSMVRGQFGECFEYCPTQSRLSRRDQVEVDNLPDIPTPHERPNLTKGRLRGWSSRQNFAQARSADWFLPGGCMSHVCSGVAETDSEVACFCVFEIDVFPGAAHVS